MIRKSGCGGVLPRMTFVMFREGRCYVVRSGGAFLDALTTFGVRLSVEKGATAEEAGSFHASTPPFQHACSSGAPCLPSTLYNRVR